MSDLLQALPNFDRTEIVRALLELTSSTNPPTHAERMARYLNLMVIEFDHKTSGLDKKIRAYLNPAQRRIGVLRRQTPEERNFCILHEIGHFVLPGHTTHPMLVNRDNVIINPKSDLIKEEIIADTLGDMSIGSVVQQEIEANKFAADCLFQLDGLDRYIMEESLEWKAIKHKADLFCASVEATARRWIERSDEECALVVFKPINPDDKMSSLKLQYTIASNSFAHAYFTRLPSGQIMSNDSIFYQVFTGKSIEVEQSLSIAMPPKGLAYFRASLWSNPYKLFALLKPLM